MKLYTSKHSIYNHEKIDPSKLIEEIVYSSSILSSDTIDSLKYELGTLTKITQSLFNHHPAKDTIAKELGYELREVKE